MTKLLHALPGILAGFCLMFVLFITSIEAVCYWTPGYYEKEYTKYEVLSDLPAMTMDNLLDVTDQMMAYLRGRRADLHVFTTMGGEHREFFTDREMAHMADVQGLFLKAIFLRRVCLGIIAAVIAGLLLAKKNLKKALPGSIAVGTVLFFAVVLVLGLIVASDFSKYFIVFHHIFFTNDLWLLDPSVDMLINIVPEPFFMDTAARILITFCVSAAATLTASIFLARKWKA